MYEKILMCLGLQGKGEMRTYWLTGEDPSKSRRNSTEAEESAATNLLLRNNNCTECICECESGQRGEPGNGSYSMQIMQYTFFHDIKNNLICNYADILLNITYSLFLEQNICPNKCLALDVNGVAVGDQPNQLINMRLFKPTTWLLAECNNGKLVIINVMKMHLKNGFLTLSLHIFPSGSHWRRRKQENYWNRRTVCELFQRVSRMQGEHY